MIARFFLNASAENKVVLGFVGVRMTMVFCLGGENPKGRDNI